ncbi:MAG: hypothetical protein WA208_16490 [Thermoanaerobaculia bacterium]
MRAIRQLAALAVVAAALWLITVRVLPSYAMNLKKREIADRTSEAYRGQETMREMAGQLARRNAEELEPWARRFPMDADLHVIRAANLRLVGREFDAAQAYGTAVRYQPTPELLVSLAETQLSIGRKREARENAMRAVAFNPAMSDAAARIFAQTESITP